MHAFAKKMFGCVTALLLDEAMFHNALRQIDTWFRIACFKQCGDLECIRRIRCVSRSYESP